MIKIIILEIWAYILVYAAGIWLLGMDPTTLLYGTVCGGAIVSVCTILALREEDDDGVNI